MDKQRLDRGQDLLELLRELLLFAFSVPFVPMLLWGGCCCFGCESCQGGTAPDSFFVTLAGIAEDCCSPPNDNCTDINGTYELTKTSTCHYQYTLTTDNHLCFFRTIELDLSIVGAPPNDFHRVQVYVHRADGGGHIFIETATSAGTPFDCTNWTNFPVDDVPTTVPSHCCQFGAATCTVSA